MDGTHVVDEAVRVQATLKSFLVASFMQMIYPLMIRASQGVPAVATTQVTKCFTPLLRPVLDEDLDVAVFFSLSSKH